LNNAHRVPVRTRTGAAIMAVVLAVAVVGTPTAARAQDAPSPPATAPAPAGATEPAPSPASPPTPATAPAPAPDVTGPDIAALERTECTRQLIIAEDAIERDGKYARNWTDAWYVTGVSLIALNLSNVFFYHDYHVPEAVVNATLATLLMIQVPDATTNHRALEGIRMAAVGDPCLALTNARYIVEVNADDAAKHQNAFAYIFPIALNAVVAAIVAVSVGHWEFAGHGDEGLSTLVGIAASELQVVTYPSPSIKFSGTSLTATF